MTRIDAPSSRHTSSFSGDPAVTATRAPTSRPSWTAIVPIPEPPPWTSRTSPGWMFAVMKMFDQTVQATSGRAAASSRLTPAGTGSSWPAGTVTFSAYPPPVSRAQTSSPDGPAVDAVAELQRYARSPRDPGMPTSRAAGRSAPVAA